MRDTIHQPDHGSNATANSSVGFAALFTAHPASVDESYLEHMRFAAGFSGKLALAAAAALVHALLPFLFEKTASTIVRGLYARTANRGAQ